MYNLCSCVQLSGHRWNIYVIICGQLCPSEMHRGGSR